VGPWTAFISGGPYHAVLKGDKTDLQYSHPLTLVFSQAREAGEGRAAGACAPPRLPKKGAMPLQLLICEFYMYRGYTLVHNTNYTLDDYTPCQVDNATPHPFDLCHAPPT